MVTKEEFGGFWVVEWSERQGIHIHTVNQMLEKNLRQGLQGRVAGFVPVAICRSAVEANQAADLFEIEQAKRAKATGA